MVYTMKTLYNQVMFFYVSRVIFHSRGARSHSGDVVPTREMRISRVKNQTNISGVQEDRFLRFASETKIVWFDYSGDPKSAIFCP